MQARQRGRPRRRRPRRPRRGWPGWWRGGREVLRGPQWPCRRTYDERKAPPRAPRAGVDVAAVKNGPAATAAKNVRGRDVRTTNTGPDRKFAVGIEKWQRRQERESWEKQMGPQQDVPVRVARVCYVHVTVRTVGLNHEPGTCTLVPVYKYTYMYKNQFISITWSKVRGNRFAPI